MLVRLRFPFVSGCHTLIPKQLPFTQRNALDHMKDTSDASRTINLVS